MGMGFRLAALRATVVIKYKRERKAITRIGSKTDRQKDRMTDRQTDRQADLKPDTKRKLNRQTD